MNPRIELYAKNVNTSDTTNIRAVLIEQIRKVYSNLYFNNVKKNTVSIAYTDMWLNFVAPK